MVPMETGWEKTFWKRKRENNKKGELRREIRSPSRHGVKGGASVIKEYWSNGVKVKGPRI